MALVQEQERIAEDPELLTISGAPLHSIAELQAQADPDAPVNYTYYRSWRFWGSYVAIGFTVLSIATCYNVPTSVLTIINEDIGKSITCNEFKVQARQEEH